MTHLGYAAGMVSQHPEDSTPPSVDPYEGMSPEQLIARAAAALKMVRELPLNSVGRAIQWAVYEDAKAELDLRLYRHVIGKLQERDGE